MDSLVGYETGKIKFFNYDKNFGFITFEDVECFTCRSWLCEPFVVSDSNIFRIEFRETNELFRPEQIVVFKPEINKDNKPEAHDVCDSLKLSFVMRELNDDLKQAIELFNTLQNYHVSIIRDIVVPRANNEEKKYDWVKIDEKVVTVFEGNDLGVLKSILGKEHIKANLNQQHTRLLFQMFYNDNWIDCDNPLLKVCG